MVSALWKACEDGDIHRVHELLKEASSVDIEVKDHIGATPLIQAVKGGHLEVVRALLAAGADPFNDSSQGSPDAHTNDPAIRQVLDETRNRALSQSQSNPQPGYPPDSYGMIGHDPKYSYYPQPYYVPAPYGPYGYMPGPPNGQMGPTPYAYYGPVPPPPQPEHQPQQQDLPPQSPFSPQPGDVPVPSMQSRALDTKNIPCRFYPSCKYGASCHYAHPQAPFQPGPLPPPAEYPPSINGVTSQASNGYYPPAQAPFPQNQAPLSPQLSTHHSRAQSEVTSPVVGPYIPNGHPQQMFSPMMHSPYPNGAHYGMPPPPPGFVQSPPMGYTPTSPVASVHPFHGRRESISGYSQGIISPLHALDPTQMPRSPPMEPGMDLNSQHPPFVPRDPQMHARRNSMQRRPMMMGKKPPCMFFPSGRCRNGNDCKYPHIIPDGPGEMGHRRGQSAGFGPIEERMGNLRIRDNHSPKVNGVNGFHGHVNGHANRENRFPNGKPVPLMNGVRRSGPLAPPSIQRLPTEEDFPVLGTLKGNSSAATTIPMGGLTAAQVLQAPAPKKESAVQNGKADSSSTSPLPNGDHVNGVHSPNSAHEITVTA